MTTRTLCFECLDLYLKLPLYLGYQGKGLNFTDEYCAGKGIRK